MSKERHPKAFKTVRFPAALGMTDKN